MNHNNPWGEEQDPDEHLAQLFQNAASTDLNARAAALEEIADLKFMDSETLPRDTMPYVQAAIELSSRLERTSQLIGLRYMQASLHMMLDEHTEAHVEASEALRLCNENFMVAYKAELTKMLARIERSNGNLVLALDYLAQSFEAADDSAVDFWGAFGALMQTTQILGHMDLFDAALEKAEQAYQYALKAHIPGAIADALNEKAWLFFRTGQVEGMPDLLERIDAHVDTVSNNWTRDFASLNRCAYEVLANEMPGTLAKLDALQEAARGRWGAGGTVAMVQYLRAVYFAKNNEVDKALSFYRKVEILAESEIIGRFSFHHIKFVSAEVAIRDARFDKGIELLREAIASLPEGDDVARVNDLRIWLAEVELQAGQAASALGELEAVPRDTWKANVAGWLRQSRLLAQVLGSLQRHTETLVVANEILSTVDANEQDQPSQRIAAEMHELKARSLAAMGDDVRARAEYEMARDAYAEADDYSSMARIAKVLGGTTAVPGEGPAVGTINGLAE